MESSLFIGKVLGLYLIIVCLAMIVRRPAFEILLREAGNNQLLLFISATIATIIGLLIVVSHNLWVADWRVVITILGWLTLLKGLVRFFFPSVVQQATKFWFENYQYVYIVSIIFLLVGIYLCAHSFRLL